MARRDVTEVECDMFYGEAKCGRKILVYERLNKAIYDTTHALGWTRFDTEFDVMRPGVDGDGILDTRYTWRWTVDACEQCAALMPPRKGKRGKTCMEPEEKEAAAARAMVVSVENGGEIPGPLTALIISDRAPSLRYRVLPAHYTVIRTEEK